MSNCEMPSVYSEEFPIACKEHKCCECGRTIKIGEKYQLYKGIWEGKAGRFKTCLPCMRLRGEISGDYKESCGVPFGELSEWAANSGYAFPPAETELLQERIRGRAHRAQKSACVWKGEPGSMKSIISCDSLKAFGWRGEEMLCALVGMSARGHSRVAARGTALYLVAAVGSCARNNAPGN